MNETLREKINMWIGGREKEKKYKQSNSQYQLPKSFIHKTEKKLKCNNLKSIGSDDAFSVAALRLTQSRYPFYLSCIGAPNSPRLFGNGVRGEISRWHRELLCLSPSGPNSNPSFLSTVPPSGSRSGASLLVKRRSLERRLVRRHFHFSGNRGQLNFTSLLRQKKAL